MAGGISKKLGGGGHEQEAYDTTTGKYVSQNETIGSNSTNKPFSLHLKHGIKINIADFKAKEVEKEKLAKQYNGQFKKYLSSKKVDFLQDSSFEDLKTELLLNKKDDFDQEKINSASFNELQNLVAAKMILAEKDVAKNQLLNIDAAIKKEFDEVFLQNLEKQGVDPNFEVMPGIWKYLTPKLSEYKTKKESGNIEAKLNFLQETYDFLINHPTEIAEAKISKDDVENVKQRLDNLHTYIDLGEKYEVIKESTLQEIKQKYAEQTNDANQTLNFLPSDEELKKAINEFTYFGGLYSEESKNAAVWAYNTEESKDLLGPLADKHWASMTKAEQKALFDYTTGSSKYNEPLRKMLYSGGKTMALEAGGTAYKAITNLTNAIDKCIWDKNIWVQRGIGSSIKMFQLPNTNTLKSLGDMSDEELEHLVGTTFKDNGFFSAGAAKGTGFSSSEVILNTYCPKGTKMCYVEPFSHYSGYGENEMILQRGYSYKITKIERKQKKYGFKIFVDCEVILGSDADRLEVDDLAKSLSQYTSN